jgi:glycosyltransferase involved in cell wall biosynthesis
MIALVLIALGIQAAYWIGLRIGFGRAARLRPAGPEAGARPAISVVVAARDEEDSLPGLLRALADQDHPDYEVIVVDDASEDATREVAHRWDALIPNLQVITITEPAPPRKKNALAAGIAAAKHELIALTDADCLPPPGWLSALAHAHAASPTPTVLVGYGPNLPRRDLMGLAARYETLVTGFLTAGAIGLGRPFMALGRNLSYPKGLFEAVGGFRDSMQSMSGDDDLLVQAFARYGARIAHLFGPETYVPSEAPLTWRSWAHQKRRHASAGRYYDRGVQAHLVAFQVSGLIVWIAPLLAGWPGAAVLLARLALQYGALRKPARILQENDLMAGQPLWDLVYAGVQAFVMPLGVMKIPARWK